jgi:hypothetical protein
MRTLFESVFPSILTTKSSHDEQRIEMKSSAGPESMTSCGFVTTHIFPQVFGRCLVIQ